MKWPPSPAKRLPWRVGLAIPAAGLERPGVDGVVDDLRPAAAAPGVAQAGQDLREAAVEADHEPVVAGLGDRVPHGGKLFRRDRERLLDEHRLAGPQRLAHQEGVAVVPRRDQDRVDVRVGEQALEVGRDALKAELRPRIGGGERRSWSATSTSSTSGRPSDGAAASCVA